MRIGILKSLTSGVPLDTIARITGTSSMRQEKKRVRNPFEGEWANGNRKRSALPRENERLSRNSNSAWPFTRRLYIDGLHSCFLFLCIVGLPLFRLMSAKSKIARAESTGTSLHYGESKGSDISGLPYTQAAKGKTKS